jgi:hypothetical protein
VRRDENGIAPKTRRKARVEGDWNDLTSDTSEDRWLERHEKESEKKEERKRKITYDC